MNKANQTEQKPMTVEAVIATLQRLFPKCSFHVSISGWYWGDVDGAADTFQLRIYSSTTRRDYIGEDPKEVLERCLSAHDVLEIPASEVNGFIALLESQVLELPVGV